MKSKCLKLIPLAISVVLSGNVYADDAVKTHKQLNSKAQEIKSLYVNNTDYPDNAIPDVRTGYELYYQVVAKREDLNHVYLPANGKDGDVLYVDHSSSELSAFNPKLFIHGRLSGFTDGVYIGFLHRAKFTYNSNERSWVFNSAQEKSTDDFNTIPGDPTYNFLNYKIKANSSASLITLVPPENGTGVRIIRSEKNGVAISSNNVLDAVSDVALESGDVIKAQWNDNIKKWVLTSLIPSRPLLGVIRHLAVDNITINTGVDDTPLYNNGRMQKPVDIIYRAKFSDSDSEVELNPEEEKYYLKVSILGREQDLLTDLYPRFKIDKVRDKRYTRSGAKSSLRNRKSNTTRIYLRYEGTSDTDIQNVLNLCVWTKGAPGTFDSVTTNCDQDTLPGNVRNINVQSSAYKIGSNLEVQKKHHLKKICEGYRDCYSRFRTRDNESADLGDVFASAWTFTPTAGRSDLKFRPIDIVNEQILAEGCIDGPKQDGICGNGKWGEMYTTNMLFKNMYKLILRYNVRQGQAYPKGFQEYTFTIDDLNVENNFAITSVMGDFYNDPMAFVRVAKDEVWKGQTPGAEHTFTRYIEDTVGNRFKLSGKLIPIEGTDWGNEPQKFLGILDTGSVNITTIY